MGEVYLVAHTQLGRSLAAKVLHAHLARDPRLVDRARVEAQSLARLHHANIVAVNGFGTTKDERPFIVMEYLRGCTLDGELKIAGFLPVAEALDFAIELLSALSAAHELGIVHRDIKPSNIFLCDPVDGKRTLKVLDFGIVRVLPDASDDAPDPPAIPTDSGVLVGTPRYLSPEGALGQRVDARADLYAAALMLYGMLTGRGPFDELERDTAFLRAHVHKEPPPPSSVGSQRIPTELDTIVLTALRKDPAARYQSAWEFKEALEKLRNALLCPPSLQPTFVVGALPIGTAVTPETRTKSRSTIWLAVALFLACGVVMAIVVAFLESGS